MAANNEDDNERYIPLHTPEKTLQYSDDSDENGSRTDESGDPLLFTSPVAIRSLVTQQSRHSLRKGILIGILAGSVVISAIIALSLGLYWKYHGDGICVERTSDYSPAFKKIDKSLHYQTFHGSLNASSKYRGKPSEELDAAWEYLRGPGMFSLSESDLISIGKNPSEEIRLPEAQGGGFMADFEAGHQLHCLNFLRKATYFNVDYYKAKNEKEFTDHPDMVRTHLDHCIEMIRMVLMCQADVGVLTYRWVKGNNRPFPNFNIRHKCRNWDSIIGWAYGQTIQNPPEGWKFKPMEGEKIWDVEP